jgi:phosphoribosylformylglycinamidine synthase
MWQFKEVIKGMAEACEVFDIPVTGGNVSFYNDTEGDSIYPTPVLGVVGMIDDVSQAVRPGFKEGDDLVLLLGENKEELGASEYLKWNHGLERGKPPQIDLTQEKRNQEFCLEVICLGILESAHDVSEGGLAFSLAECSLLSKNKIGFAVNLEDRIRPDALFFGETQSRIIVTVKKQNLERILELSKKRKVKARVIGETGGERMIISHQNKRLIDIPVSDAYRAWKNAIPEAFETNRKSSESERQSVFINLNHFKGR